MFVAELQMQMKVRLYGQHFSSTCLATLLYCKLKPSFARIITFVTNLSHSKIYRCKPEESPSRITDQSFVLKMAPSFI